MAEDPTLPLTDVQYVLGHAQLTSTQIYLNSRELHQMGEESQVVWSAGLRSRPARLWPACV
jgi:site-specific recombinase XerC